MASLSPGLSQTCFCSVSSLGVEWALWALWAWGKGRRAGSVGGAAPAVAPWLSSPTVEPRAEGGWQAGARHTDLPSPLPQPLWQGAGAQDSAAVRGWERWRCWLV